MPLFKCRIRKAFGRHAAATLEKSVLRRHELKNSPLLGVFSILLFDSNADNTYVVILFISYSFLRFFS